MEQDRGGSKDDHRQATVRVTSVVMASRHGENQRMQPNSSARGGMSDLGRCARSKQSWEHEELGDGVAVVANCDNKMSSAGGEQDKKERRAPVTRFR